MSELELGDKIFVELDRKRRYGVFVGYSRNGEWCNIRFPTAKQPQGYHKSIVFKDEGQ